MQLADQCLCFCHTDGTIALLPKSEISTLKPSSVAVQPGLGQTCTETPKTGFVVTRIILVRLNGMLRLTRFFSGHTG